MIKPGCPRVVDIDTSSNIVNGGIWTRTKTSRPLSTRVEAQLRIWPKPSGVKYQLVQSRDMVVKVVRMR
jgi:hypothetical protein